uniref:MHC class I-like antigen recognition-like domain-containing protein n=1 Tax=Sphenodon punctatus TaxID=8508 RepID=A0A8D0GJN7_SPHPU
TAPDGQHSLSYQFSGLYEGLTLQEFSTVGLLDKAPIELDNQGHPARVPTRSPTQEYLGAEFGAEESWTQSPKKTWDQVLGEVLKQQSNQTHGRQTLQWRYGCEVVPGGLVLSWFQFALDGADAILFDVGNGRWLAAQPWAQAPCRWWEALPAFGRSLQRYLGDACPERMESFLRRRQERARRAGTGAQGSEGQGDWAVM